MSGSSGRLVVERLAEEKEEKEWPGRVFEQEELSYNEAMLAFVNAPRTAEAANSTPTEDNDKDEKAQKRALRQEEEQLRRQQRRAEEVAWRAMRADNRRRRADAHPLDQATRKMEASWWPALCQQRKQILASRRQQDDAWRQQRLALRERGAAFRVVTAWLAILVITDNCTRQCLSLPLFLAGSHVTSEMIVNALQALLPPELLFLIF